MGKKSLGFRHLKEKTNVNIQYVKIILNNLLYSDAQIYEESGVLYRECSHRSF